MNIVKRILVAASVILSTSIASYAQSDVDLNQKIENLEAKISKVKSGIPEEDKKKYFASLSDVENRKNNLKSMMKTPADKRDKNWQQNWDQNYTKAHDKLDKIQAK